MRHHSVDEAKRLRKAHHRTVFVAGLFIAAFVSIPIVNLATPLFGTAMMVHIHKQVTRAKRVANSE
jgi:CysZ protein